MTSVLWEIASVLDEERIPATVENSVWLAVPAARLRGPGAQANNRWLRECLERLTGLQIRGQYRGANWGAVLIAEWHLERGDELARLLVPPAAVQALRASETFAKVETEAVHRLRGPARRLYVALSDKKRLARREWEYSLDELRQVLGVSGLYRQWSVLRRDILLPALAGVHEFGTVDVWMVPQKTGRSVTSVLFSWKWKDLHAAAETVAENARSEVARGKQQSDTSAPPLTRQASWARIQEAFEVEYGAATWQSWCADLRLAEGSAGAVTIAAPSAFRCDRIQADYGEWFSSAWEAEEAGVIVEFGLGNDLDLEHARKWWLGAPKKLRISALLNLGIQSPAAADLVDDTPHIQDISDLLIYFNDPVDVRSERWAARRKARQAPPAPAPAAEDVVN